jgi:hypothetical protein
MRINILMLQVFVHGIARDVAHRKWRLNLPMKGNILSRRILDGQGLYPAGGVLGL